MNLSRARRDGVLCSLLVVASVLATWPVAEMGFQDDWSYIRSALDFARTGHFLYNGWATAMLGWMIPWGAAFIKLFGFSFTAVRLSMLPLDAAMTYMFHSCLIRCGVNRRNAVLGALTLGLSPVTTPVAASFMSDIPGIVVVLLCSLLCIRAVRARTDRSAIALLCAAAATNVVGGTVRQIAWLGALGMVPSTAWLLRRRRGVLPAGIVLWLASLLGIAGFMYWWNHQPYSVPEHIDRGHITATMVHHFGGRLAKAFLCLVLLLYPVLAAWLADLRRLSRYAVLRIATVTALTAIALVRMDTGMRNLWVVPWVGHLLFSVIYGRGEFPGPGPVTVNLTARAVLSLIVIFTALVFAERMWATRNDPPPPKQEPEFLTWREIAWVFGPFCAAYTLLLMPRAMYEFLYDRYLFGLMPFAIIVLLRWYQRQSVRVGWPAFVALTVFALVAITGTHDWFAVNRARVRAVEEVHAAGVPKTSIQGGFEYDGWTQIEAGGYINEKRIAVPANAYHQFAGLDLPENCTHFFSTFVPAIHPRFVIVHSLLPCFAPSAFPPVTYTAWFPPFHRSIYVQSVRNPLP